MIILYYIVCSATEPSAKLYGARFAPAGVDAWHATQTMTSLLASKKTWQNQKKTRRKSKPFPDLPVESLGSVYHIVYHLHPSSMKKQPYFSRSQGIRPFLNGHFLLGAAIFFRSRHNRAPSFDPSAHLGIHTGMAAAERNWCSGNHVMLGFEHAWNMMLKCQRNLQIHPGHTYHILSYRIVSYRIISYHIISHDVVLNQALIICPQYGHKMAILWAILKNRGWNCDPLRVRKPSRC